MKQSVFRIAGVAVALLTACSGPKWTETAANGFVRVENKGGPVLGYHPESGVSLIIEDGFAFKDLNRNGGLDPYEDWRLPVADRASDLASRMSVEQIAGLMLYSAHQRLPGGGFGGRDTYDGKTQEESGAASYDLTDQQVKFLTEDNLRHVLITTVESPEVAARWNNNVQGLVEGLGLGIPANNSTDPRHEAQSDEEYTLGAGGAISRWPGAIGLAASFDPALVRRFGEIASAEYRALGLATALSPQVDLATDPRWYRFSGTFGPDPGLSIDMARAYVDGFQTTSESPGTPGGWGSESVNAMVKHWPGGGAGEAGRDAHYGFGKFAVFPGNNLAEHMRPFTEGAFALEGGTGKAAAVMPYYTISFGQDPGGDQVGNAFSRYFITEQLREKYGYDGVVCTDWGVTRTEEGMATFGRTPWGVEGLTEAERHYRILMAGCDQFGGNNDAGPVLEAYAMGVEELGEDAMRARFQNSARRLLTNIFQVGLFENPYVDVAHTVSTVGKPEFMEAGYQAQLRSLVLVKNRGQVLPLNRETRVYIPQRYVPESETFFGDKIPGRWEDALKPDLASRYITPVSTPDSADVALVVITDPENGRTAGYSTADAEAGGNGFLPISLQYGPYTATEARDPSLAGDSRETDVLNRTYRGKTATAKNYTDLERIRKTVGEMAGKPVVVVLRLSNPTVVAEFEAEVGALLLNFNVSDQAVLDILTGAAEPSGLLPMQLPSGMETVERQFEDVPLDMTPHTDSEGHRYDFGFGLDWQGPINDARTRNYGHSDR